MMNRKKMIMKGLFIGLLMSISMIGFAQEKNFIDKNYIEVTGKAELEILPDLIYLKIVLSDKNNKDKQTLPEIEKKMIDKMSEIGIDVNKDLSLVDLVSNLKVYLFKTDVILTKQYQLLVHDTKTLQKVFIEFQKMGISNVSIVKLEHSDIEQYRKEVKISAVKAAKEKAEMLAIALSQRIGKALYVQEVAYMNPMTSYSNIMIRGISSSTKSSSSPAETDMEFDIEFEKIRIESTFLVRFELE